MYIYICIYTHMYNIYIYIYIYIYINIDLVSEFPMTLPLLLGATQGGAKIAKMLTDRRFV